MRSTMDLKRRAIRSVAPRRNGPNSLQDGFTRTEVLWTIAVIAFLVVIVISFLTPPLVMSRQLANRAVCSVNLRSLIQSMIIYAQDNSNMLPATGGPESASSASNKPRPTGQFPAASGPMGSTYVNNPDITTADLAATPQDAAAAAFGTGIMARSPLASMWLLVLNGQMTVKSFICPGDPYATEPSDLYNTSGQYFENFGVVNGRTSSRGLGESYSIDFPWAGKTGHIGGWWMNNITSDLPLAADMAPASDRRGGKLARDPLLPLQTSNGLYIFNSGNHRGDGENVGFGDDHVVWENNPYVGENSDSIYSYDNISSAFPTDGARACGSTGGNAAYHSWKPGTTKAWDVWMAPVRDVRNGRW